MENELDLGSSMEETYAAMQTGGGSAAEDVGAASPPTPSLDSSQSGNASSAPAAAPASVQNAWDSMPKSWRKEMEARWGGVDPEVRKYVHEREKQALDGIMQYKSQADRWSQTTQPFQKWFEHYKIDPHEAFGRLAQSHIVLKYGKPEDRARYAQQLVQDYGLAEVLGLQPKAQQGQGPSPAALPNEQLVQMQQRLDAVQDAMYQQQLKENMAVAEKFFSDPANEYAAELQEDILRLFEQGRASTLQEAYETAKWQNPAIRQKLIQREVQAAAKPSRPGPLNVKPSSVSPAPTESADESIEETMKATLERIRSR
jgi:hypothetical protein